VAGCRRRGRCYFDPLEEAFRRHARMDWARKIRVVAAALGQERVGRRRRVGAVRQPLWNAD